MKKLLVALAALALSSTALWAPPYNGPFELVSSPPTGGCTQTNIIKRYINRSTGTVTDYGCLGSRWAILTFSPDILEATNSPAVGLCVQVDPSDVTKFQFVTCSSGGSSGGTSTIKECSGAPPCAATAATTSVATTLAFGPGLDVAATTTVSSNDTANITLDLTENPVVLTTMVSGQLPVANGGTAAATAADARTNLGAAARGANTDITSLDLTTALAVSDGGSGLGGAAVIADDQILLGASTNVFAAATLPNCPSGNQLLYILASNTFSCEADGSAGTGSVRIIQEEGASLGSDGSGTTLNFVNSTTAGTLGALTASGTGTVKTITLSQTGTGTKVVDDAYTVTGGAGINVEGSDSAQTFSAAGTDLALTTDSNELNFLASAAISCAGGASDQGKVTYQSTVPLAYCDTTIITKYAAYGNNTGASLTGDSGDAFFVTGTVDVANGGTNATSLGAVGQLLVSGGTGAVTANADLAFDDSTNTLTVAGPIITSSAPDGSRYAEVQRNTFSSAMTANTGYLKLFAKSVNNLDGSERLYTSSLTLGVKEVLAGAVTEDAILVGNANAAVNTYEIKALPSNCGASDDKLLYDHVNNAFSCGADAGASAGAAGGSTTQMQYNNAGTLDGTAGLTWTSGSSSLAFADATLLDLSLINNSGAAEGLVIPRQAGTPTTGFTTTDGQLDWDSTNNIPYWGNGDASPNSWTQGVTTTGTQTLTNKTLTAPVISTISNTGTTTLFTATDTVVGKATTDILTNKTLDVEGTGNVITTVDKVWLPAAGCNNTTVTPFFDLFTSNTPVAACITGSNTTKGVLDFNAAADENVQSSITLPSDWTGAIDVKIKYLTGTGDANAIGWCVQLICVADAETDDPAFPAQAAGNCVSDTNKGTANQTNDATITGVTATGCAAGELMHIQVSRDANGSAVTDSFLADARFIGLELTLRRAQ